MRKLTFYIILTILLSLGNLNAQNEPIIRVKHLDYQDGLVGKRAVLATQDNDGFMWIATMDALNRYDGFSFRHFNQSNSKLNYQELRRIHEDGAGYIWLFYLNNGIEFIHHQTFEVLSFEERFPDAGFTSDEVKDLIGNEQGDVLFLLKNAKK